MTSYPISPVSRGNLLITGGTGTLGTAIVRTAIAEQWPCRITIFSRSELRQAQMRALYPQCRYIIGDVRNVESLQTAFVGHDTVIHAAAMKRIPEAEAQPVECMQTNVIGSANVARAVQQSGVKLVIGISTDKACKASTTYGASKLLMEGIWKAQSPLPTRFVLCRYGNVLGSNGSVLELWRKQHEAGEPLTITDARCTRFWMSEADAVRTIVRASELTHGQCFVPRIAALGIEELAKAIYPGAKVRDVGLRSLEKLHEDLIGPDERATVVLGGYLLWAQGDAGTSYSSDKAPRLDADEIRAMLKEAM